MAQKLIDFACGSSLLNTLLDAHAATSPTIMYSKPGKQFQELKSVSASVVWGGAEAKQSFARSPDLPAAFVSNPGDLALTRQLAQANRLDIEKAIGIDRDAISSKFDHVDAGGGVIFFSYDRDRLTEIAFDCGQNEPAD